MTIVENLTIQGLLIASAGFSFLYGLLLTWQRPSVTRTIVKTIPVLCLAIAAMSLMGPRLLTVGLFLGAMGDAFLSRDGDRNFILGLGSFLMGHLAFVLLFFSYGLGLEIFLDESWRLVLVGILGLIAVLITNILLPRLGPLKMPVMAYVSVILLMGIGALQLPVVHPTYLALVGAIMFVASDAILAFNLFVWDEGERAKTISAPVLWFLYWGGQFLFLLGLVVL